LFFKENATGEIMVKESERNGREMYNDGIIVASTGPHLYSHIYPAHLTSLLAHGPHNALVIGFGSGITSGSMLLYDETKSLDAVEICNGIIEPSKKYFSEVNNNVFMSKKLNLIIQDGKNYVRMTDKTYDIIYSGPSLPQANQGSAALFTKEFFGDCKRILARDGLQCIWVPLHTYSPEDYLTIVKTFLEVYPHVSLWHLPQTDRSIGQSYLIGSNEELYPDYQSISEKLKRPEIINDLKRLGDACFQSPEEFISQLCMGKNTLKRITAGITVINTDDRPVVEFYNRMGDLMQAAVMSKVRLIEILGRNMEDPYDYVQNVPDDKKEELRGQLARLCNGTLFLMMGHQLTTLKEFLSFDGKCPPGIDNRINQYYAQAFALIPESADLRKHFGTTDTTRLSRLRLKDRTPEASLRGAAPAKAGATRGK
jgi:spermidine synthase